MSHELDVVLHLLDTAIYIHKCCLQGVIYGVGGHATQRGLIGGYICSRFDDDERALSPIQSICRHHTFNLEDR